MSATAKILAVVLLGVALRGSPAPAEPASPAPTPSAAPAAADPAVASWIQRLDKARDDLTRARSRVKSAEAAWSEALYRHYPTGDARAALKKELDQARGALAEAKTAWPRLLEDARRDGVPPGVLRRYE